MKKFLRLTACAILAASLSLVCGCGTILANMGSGATENYGGINLDKETAASIKSEWRSPEGNKPSMILLPFVYLDMPFSFVADTIILPYTAPRARKYGAKQKSGAKK